MANPSLIVRWNNSELHVIPARHFWHVFAEGVNGICAHPATQPEAIAVELGPGTVHAALNWLFELGVGTPDFGHFPVMLALLKRNRMIRASFRKKAWRLQREKGKDITEFSPGFLRRNWGSANIAYFFSLRSIQSSKGHDADWNWGCRFMAWIWKKLPMAFTGPS